MRAKTKEFAEVEVFVTLRVPDRVAITAARALSERLGYAEILADFKRQKYFRFAVAGDPDEALAYVRALAAGTSVVANPTERISSSP